MNDKPIVTFRAFFSFIILYDNGHIPVYLVSFLKMEALCSFMEKFYTY